VAGAERSCGGVHQGSRRSPRPRRARPPTVRRREDLTTRRVRAARAPRGARRTGYRCHPIPGARRPGRAGRARESRVGSKSDCTCPGSRPHSSRGESRRSGWKRDHKGRRTGHGQLIRSCQGAGAPAGGMWRSDCNLPAQIKAERPAHPPPRSREARTRRIAVSTARPMRASSSGSLKTHVRPADPS
jgi:hypothetical protein